MEASAQTKPRRLVTELTYEIAPVVKGYSDKTLHINLSDYSVRIKDVPESMKEKFIGGKGYGLKYLWEATKSTTKWNDPENGILI